MSSNYFDADWTEKITLPVKRVGAHWEFFYGGDVPVREGTLGELTLDARDITNEKFKQRVMQEVSVKILDEGTELLVALTDHDTKGRLIGYPEKMPMHVPWGTTRFAKVRLGPQRPKKGQLSLDTEISRGGLWLKVKGLERCELQASTVLMPEGFEEPAVSLNHAFTLLSERYEKHRLSHTGNVYSRVFYCEGNGHWFPLDDLRRGVLVTAERNLLKSAWDEVEQALGWRPSPAQAKSSKKPNKK